MKKSSVFGTPVNSISANNGQGNMPPGSRPPRNDGTTTLPQFKGDQSQQPNPRSGTPFNSYARNDDIQRLASDYGYGVSPVAGGADANTIDGTGGATMFKGLSREGGYSPNAAGAMDSPVAKGTPHFNPRTMRDENLAHLGEGADPAQAADVLLNIGGVMSK
jgi:hypothetical protein